MEQFKDHTTTKRNRTFRLSDYDMGLLKRNAEKSQYNNTTAYLEWLINQEVVRKPLKRR